MDIDGRDRMDRIFYDGYGISEPGNRDTDHPGSSGSNEKRRLSGNPPGRRLWESAKLRVLEQNKFVVIQEKEYIVMQRVLS